MRRVAVLAALAAWVGAAVAFALGGCGGDEASQVIEGSDGGNASSSSGGSSANSTSSSSSTSSSGSSGMGGDGGHGDGGDGGTSSSGSDPSNPGKVTCGTTECDAGMNAALPLSYCCVRDAGATCENTAAGCGGFGSFVTELFCDEPADCTGNHACCVAVAPSPGGMGPAQCSPAATPCPVFAMSLCKTNADCDGGTCQAITCHGHAFHSCYKPAYCN
jgi:hypothetical protein